MSDLQPNGSQSSSNLPLTYVVDLCERFELEWRGGGTPRIETYLEGIAPGERERLLRELLAVEVELRISQGENPTPEKLRMRYPDWGHAITIALERGREAAEAARGGMVRLAGVRHDGNALGPTRRLSSSGIDQADVTVGSVCWPDAGTGGGGIGTKPTRARAVRGDQGAGRDRPTRGRIPGPGRADDLSVSRD